MTFHDTLTDSWTGRVDGPDPHHALWHTAIRPLPSPEDSPSGVALLGFASDEGIRRNHGRPGRTHMATGPNSAQTPLRP